MWVQPEQLTIVVGSGYWQVALPRSSPSEVKMKTKTWLVATVGLAVSVGFGARFLTGEDAAAASPYRTGAVTIGTVESTVTSTGQLTALQSIAVGTQVSGQVIQLYADYNEKVRKGQLLARIDPTLEKVALLAIGALAVWWGLSNGSYIFAAFLAIAVLGHLRRGAWRSTAGPLSWTQAGHSLGLYLLTAAVCAAAGIAALLPLAGGSLPDALAVGLGFLEFGR